jgi:hypothetical protein
VIKEQISIEQFRLLARPLIGMPLSHTWQGHGSAIFFEFGKLSDGYYTKGQRGEATLMIEWSWRIERPKSILFGSFSSQRKIDNGLPKLEGLDVVDFAICGRLPELVVQLTQGIWIHSFSTVEGQPQWCLFLPNGSWVYSDKGKLQQETQTEP